VFVSAAVAILFAVLFYCPGIICTVNDSHGLMPLNVAKRLPGQVAGLPFQSVFEEIWLAESAAPGTRAHGCYRHPGWVRGVKLKDHCDEIREWSNSSFNQGMQT
jgi:hypothetical protein